MNYIYELKNIDKTHGKIKALNRLSLKIPESKFIVVLGASGSGKSTLLNLIGFMDGPTSGEIMYDGKNVSALSKKELTKLRADHIGFIFQNYNLLNSLTALENVEFSCELKNHDLEYAKECLNAVGLKDRYDNFPQELSGGEVQRVSIARAIAKKPKVLLCDEPTGALDSETGIVVLEALYSVYQEHKTSVVLITHNSEIAKIADIIIHIKDGTVLSIENNENKVAPTEVMW